MPQLSALLAFVRSGDRICPEPGAWVKLHRLLGEGAPTPLILAGWYAPDWVKRRQLETQLRFAAERGRLDRVDHFLRRLPEAEWYIERDADPEPLIFRLLEEAPPARPAKGSRQLSFRLR